MKEITRYDCSFEEIRDIDSIYVDKTKYIYNLVEDDVNYYYFITRPSGFGKSLMCSTLHALFEGKRELFKGLYIDSTDYSFEKYPVLHFNFARMNISASTTYEKFVKSFQDAIIREAKQCGITVEREEPCDMLLSILYNADKNVVIIVDDYDAPIIHTYEDTEKADKIKDTISTFYSVIKNTGEKIRFVFITGVVRLTSVLYAINNITDITFDENYTAAFGYTEEELLSSFSSYIDEYMERDDREYETREDFLDAIREYYGGYRFSYENPVSVYNPIFVGKFFTYGCCFEPHWENTDVSMLAINLVREYKLGRIICNDMKIGLSMVTTFDYLNLASRSLNSSQVLALLYFIGYLTIKDGNSRALTLTSPNTGVRYSFTESLMNFYLGLNVGVYADDAQLIR